MKKILFPTDYSAASDNAFRYALHVADKTNAELVTLHVFQKPDVGRAKYSSTMRDIYEHNEMEELEMSQKDAKHLNDIALEENLQHLTINRVLEEGETISTILEVADREEVDMIILGSNGKSNISEYIFGSNAAGVVEQAHCFVMSIPQNAKFDGKLNKIAIATSFTEIEKKAFPKFLEVARKYNLEVICVNVDNTIDRKDEQNKDEWEKEFGGDNVSFETIQSTYVADTLNQYMIDKNVDIVAMLTKRRSFFEKLFSSSLTKKMVYYQKTPVLALQAHSLD